MQTSYRFPVFDSSQVGEVRRLIHHRVIEEIDFNETLAGKVSIVVTELASNLVKHASGGELVVRFLEQESNRGIEILCLDRGIGMADVGACLRDGYSTAGSAGNGLGAIQRLSTVFEINSVPKVGTAILSQIWATPLSRFSKEPVYGAVSVPHKNETICGDAWAVDVQSGRYRLFVTDGLGHGVAAAEASQEAVRVFQGAREQTAQEVLLFIHNALRKTRGAAVALACVDFEDQSIHFSGIGNISATVVSPDLKSQSFMSHNGTAGAETCRIKGMVYPWTQGSLLVMHSDGISARWQLSKYPGLFLRHPSLIAGVLFRDFQRGNDDATIVVIKGAAS